MDLSEDKRRALKEDGYCVVPNVLNSEDCDKYISQYKSWLDSFPEANPMRSRLSLVKDYAIGHCEAAWSARLAAKPVFAALWETEKLLTSIDALAIAPPPTGEKEFDKESDKAWLHCDQKATRQGLHAYQGAVYLEAASEDDYCLRVLKKSHNCHQLFFNTFPSARKKSVTKEFYRLTKGQSPLEPIPPMFMCSNQIDSVPYTCVCDHHPDCSDHSDEDFCHFPACTGVSFHCGTNQCIPNKQRCDGIEQCANGVDELQCKPEDLPNEVFLHAPSPPARVNFNDHGDFTVTPVNVTLNESSPCPDTHFQCPDRDFYCLPVYVRCNGVFDCPDHEDEIACDSYTCPGFYRCRASRICLHPDHLCDEVFQCPQRDDEWFCNVTCPDTCTCYGHAFFCSGSFSVHMYPDLRFLNGRGSGLTPTDVTNNILLIYLDLSFCNLRSLVIPTLSNLKTLDVSDNHLISISFNHLSNVSLLNTLILAGNPLVSQAFSADQIFPSLHNLDLSRIDLQHFNVSILDIIPNLQILNLSNSGVDRVTGEGFLSLRQLRQLDLRDCPMTHFPPNVFKELKDLQTVYADNYKLCCSAILPEDFNPYNCQAPSDEISSCEALLRSNVYRILLAVFGSFALLGNMASFVYRIVSGTSRKFGFGVFVIHLCASDFLMGVYLAVIGIADRLYLGTYLWKEIEWKHSAVCQVAGFLSLLSSEVSAFIICLITLDRFLVLRFPFSQFRFRNNSAHVACTIVWCTGFTIAAVPLLPVTSHWDFYSQTGICIPLPIIRHDFAGQKYSYAVIVVLNFVLSLMIVLGQLVIYWSIKANSMSSTDTSRKSKDLAIARRLITIALSNFLCWFPIGILGLLAFNGVAIPGELSVAMAIIALPLNSALNPFLYTLNLILEKRRRAKEARLRKYLLSQLQTNINATPSSSQPMDKLKLTYTGDDAIRLLEKWLAEKLLSTEQLTVVTRNKIAEQTTVNTE